jgi:hypothetical protein
MDFITEVRGTEGKPERYSIVAAELVRMRVDVIVAAGPTLPALTDQSTKCLACAFSDP